MNLVHRCTTFDTLLVDIARKHDFNTGRIILRKKIHMIAIILNCIQIEPHYFNEQLMCIVVLKYDHVIFQ